MESFKVIGIVDAYSSTHFIEFWSKLYPNKDKDNLYYYPLINSNNINSELLLKYFELRWEKPLVSLRLGSFKLRVLPRLSRLSELKRDNENDFSLIYKTCGDMSVYWVPWMANLINSQCFPIFDIHVFRAFQFIENKTTDTTEYEHSKIVTLYLNKYLPFFEKLKQNNLSLDRMLLYQALWTFGKFLEDYKNVVE